MPNHAPISRKDLRWMRLTAFVSLLATFVATTVLTLAAVFFGLGDLSDAQENVLIGACLVEAAASILLIFRHLFGLGENQ